MRLERERALSAVALQAAETRLQFLREHWTEVLPSDALRRSAERILRVHTLRAADSLQLAAALALCRKDPEGVAFVSFDERMRAAAYREGFKPA